jgi:hypothetical protein
VFSFPVSFENREDSIVLPLVSSTSFDTSLVEVMRNLSITHTFIVKRLDEVVCLLLGFRPFGQIVVV